MLTQHISWGSTNINKWNQALDSGDSIDHNNLMKQSKNKVDKIRERLGQQSLSAKANQITEILVKLWMTGEIRKNGTFHRYMQYTVTTVVQ